MGQAFQLEGNSDTDWVLNIVNNKNNGNVSEIDKTIAKFSQIILPINVITPQTVCNIIINNNINFSSKHLKFLDKNWKLVLYLLLNTSKIVNNIELEVLIPFDIFYMIISYLEGALRYCTRIGCEKRTIDMRYTYGYGCKMSKKEIKKYTRSLCTECQLRLGRFPQDCLPIFEIKETL